MTDPLKIAIASGKGGTGKTMLSTNLASFISQTENVLLVDLDVEEPNDALFIHGQEIQSINQYKMIPEWDAEKCTLCGVCSTNCMFHAVLKFGNRISVFNELCHSCYACSELCPMEALPMKQHIMGETKTWTLNKMTFIESRLSTSEEQASPLIRQTLYKTENEFQKIPLQIFDCPPGTNCSVIAATKNADYVVLVTEPTPFGLNDLKLAVETMRLIHKKIGVVVNRSLLENDCIETYCQEQQIPIIARIPFDKQLAKLYSKGELAYKQVPYLKEQFELLLQTIKDVRI